MSSIDPISTQKDEMQALRSIFGKEFKLHRPRNFKKIFEPPCLSITIVSSDSNIGIKTVVQLCFDCSATYPISPPQISLKEADCISIELQDNLLRILREKSLELLGVPMIHQLVEYARDYLRDIHKPVVVAKQIIKEQLIIDSENKQKINLQLLRERKDSAKKENFNEKYIEKCLNLNHNDSQILKFEHCSDKVPFDVYRGICEGHHTVTTIKSGGKMVFNVFEGFHILKGNGVKIYQISLQNLSKKTLDIYKTGLLKKLEEDFYLLYKLNHCNVLPYLAFRYQTTEKIIDKERTFELDIQYLTPNIGGMQLMTQCKTEISCNETSQALVRIPMAKIRLYLSQVLDGIRYLHEKDITNIKLKIDSILIDKNFQLKIANYFIWKRFDELKFAKHRDENVTNAKKGSKRNDILKIGKLAKQLYFYGLPDNDMKEEEIPSDLMGFIDSTRSNVSDLHNHPFFCPQVSSKDIHEEHDKSLQTDDLSAWECFNKFSRIPTEFELICKVGEGAFGDVVKVKNIYDSQFYAIKRVKLNAFKKKDSRRTMKEVQLLSSLNHENIVRYYASWSEDILQTNSGTDYSSSEMTDNRSLINNLSLGLSIVKRQTINSSLFEMEEMTNRINNDFYNGASDSSRGHFFDINSESDEDSNDSDVEMSMQEYHKPSVTSKGYVNDKSSMEVQTNPSKILKYLMIQMELCEGPCNTLDKYINEEQLYLNEKLIWKLIREIVSGLEHIHSKNMIHRDLKPSNIFIDSQKKIKIGDLGLATNFDTKALDTSLNLIEENGPVGTIMYICPEMLNHKPYNSKADMYSLGIIVFEMCYLPFNTASERYKILGHIRQPEIVFPSENEFKIKDKFKALITLLLNHDPMKRPSSSDLLKSSIIPPPEAREMELRNGLKEIIRDSSSAMYKWLLNNMFNQASSKMGGYELPLLYQSPFKYYISNTKPNLSHSLRKRTLLQIDDGDYTFFTIKRLIIRFIESVFISHGAVEFTAPILSPKTVWTENQAFPLLDSEGIVVNLPTNLRDNFANFLLNNDIYSSRRYAIDSIYCQQEYRRDHPIELLEAVLDIVSDYKSENIAVEAIYVIHEIFSKLFRQEHIVLKLEINNTELFHAIMKYYRIPDNIQTRILSLAHDKPDSDMSYLETDEFKQTTSLTESQLTHLKSILTYRGRLEDLEKFLKIYFNKSRDNPCCQAISDAFYELLTIVQRLDRFPQPLGFEVLVRPIYIPKNHIYKGFVFQLLFALHEKFIDLVKPTIQTNTNVNVKFLKSINKICLGGDYSNFLMKARRQSVLEVGDIICYESTIGLSIDLSTLIQCVYSIEQLLLTTSGECAMNRSIDVIIQYDSYFDSASRELLAALWRIGVATVLYDRGDAVENYVLQNRIGFLVEFLKGDDRRMQSDYRIIIMKNDSNGIGLEQVSNDDCKTIEKAVEVILKEQKKNEALQLRFKSEYCQPIQKQLSESSTTDSIQEVDIKKTLPLKAEVPVGRYTYVFVSVKENRENKIDLKYLVETNRQIQSVRSKNPDFDLANIQMLVNLNTRLININKWFQSKFPSQLFIIIVELSYDKCAEMVLEVSLKNLKDSTKLGKIISKIESSVNYSSNTEKHWKDVISRLWKEIQEASKDKISKLLIYSNTDDNFVFVDIK